MARSYRRLTWARLRLRTVALRTARRREVMSRRRIATQWFALPLLVTFLWGAPPATTVIQKPAIAPVRDPKIPQLQRVSAISPLRFEPNLGQAGPEVRYIARGSGYLLLLAGQEAVMVLPSGSASPATVRMKLVGA